MIFLRELRRAAMTLVLTLRGRWHAGQLIKHRQKLDQLEARAQALLSQVPRAQ
jgi:hypothetical protein